MGMAKQIYQQGTIFGVKMDDGQFAIGTVVQCAPNCPIVVCAFATTTYPDLSMQDVRSLEPTFFGEGPLLCGDLYLESGRWPILDSDFQLSTDAIKVTSWVEGPDLRGRNFKVELDSDDLSKITSRTEIQQSEAQRLPDKILWDSRSTEIRLTMLLVGRDAVDERRSKDETGVA